MTILKKIYKVFLLHKHLKTKAYCIYCGSKISFFRVIIKYNQCKKCESWWKKQHKFILLYSMDEIKTAKEYKVFLKLAETLIEFDPCRETPLGELLILIGKKIEKYESKKFTIDKEAEEEKQEMLDALKFVISHDRGNLCEDCRDNCIMLIEKHTGKPIDEVIG